MTNCKLYINLSNRNVFDKNLLLQATVPITFKDRVDVINPVIRLTYNELYLKANYMFLEMFNRYYFVEKREIINNEIIYTLHVDVIYTFKDQIKACNATAERCSKDGKYNRYLNDKEFMGLQNSRITITKFPSGFAKDADKQSYILLVGG